MSLELSPGIGKIVFMKTSDFDYHLPPELIALYPLSKREECRLMVVDRKTGTIEHRRFFELPYILKAEDLLVLNNTRVIPARLTGRVVSSNRRCEVLLTERISSCIWKGLMKKPKNGMLLEFEGGLKGKVFKDGRDEWVFEFSEDVDDYLERFGKMPLPPYIQRDPEEDDKLFYQTVYASKKGSVAAPTAGLHFSETLIDEIKKKGIEIRFVTLHVGVGSFKPVKVESIEGHKMHPEYREITEEVAFSVNRAKSEGRRVIAVGTTVVRALESAVCEDGSIKPISGYTDLFIYPGFNFRVVDALITNFHLPRSTLLMLVAAFSGRELIMRAYEEAKKERYRFLSYGDAMLIL